MNKIFTIATLLALFCSSASLKAQELYTLPADADTRWVSFENHTGKKGKGGMENKTAKGHSSEWVNAGKSVTLLDFDGAGVINRIWMTIIDRNPEALRAIHIEMYWDGTSKPAVSAPLGDFFGIGLGRMTAFQSALFTDPEGRSFNCYAPMPFKRHARIVLVNESKQNQLLFYDVNLTKLKKHPRDIAYFHAYWSNSTGRGLGEDFEILPKVNGKGRFLGTNIGVIADKVYGDTWFGEGEVKTYLDGDKDYPTLNGTGTEDYIGSAWNLGPFSQLYQGATVVDKQKKQFAFYRYHIPDPIYFHTDCRVTIQQMGGAGRDLIRAIAKAGGKVKPVSVMTANGLIKLLDVPSYPDLFDDKFPADEWVNFYRVDNYSATAYFYLDKPESNLPALPVLAERLKGL
ncbi:glycoside hydrolase family 172 protein [Mucilaginibacter sabulilitoris]|uniref:Glycoside hydrolase family 172 protein n=1 Tax=Mucilaginibacter sabulilitoris TaxID=1173583 RepID=A0ABZ0TE41_9SPHI|nr:glycoside hydrolase family 172 protein [Mucilaginibacter sabulilitoris]WPU91466.1 glycoside hydrolase family 172 protein [Mucilaginibacter sabulilitoris]